MIVLTTDGTQLIVSGQRLTSERAVIMTAGILLSKVGPSKWDDLKWSGQNTPISINWRLAKDQYDQNHEVLIAPTSIAAVIE